LTGIFWRCASKILLEETRSELVGGEGLSGFNVFLKYGNAETQHVR